MNGQNHGYSAEGVELNGYLCDGSDGGPAPGILVIHEGPGLSGHVRRRAEALADHGYVAFALDLYGEGELDLETTQLRVVEMMTTPGLMVSRASAGLRALASQPSVDVDRMAAVGFCLGGVVALELARALAPIRCAVGSTPA